MSHYLDLRPEALAGSLQRLFVHISKRCLNNDLERYHLEMSPCIREPFNHALKAEVQRIQICTMREPNSLDQNMSTIFDSLLHLANVCLAYICQNTILIDDIHPSWGMVTTITPHVAANFLRDCSGSPWMTYWRTVGFPFVLVFECFVLCELAEAFLNFSKAVYLTATSYSDDSEYLKDRIIPVSKRSVQRPSIITALWLYFSHDVNILAIFKLCLFTSSNWLTRMSRNNSSEVKYVGKFK